MNEHWRPEGWIFSQPIAQVDKDYKEGELASAKLLTPSEKALFEAGADAMLEALKEKGTRVIKVTELSKKGIRGWSIFIEDDPKYEGVM